MANIDLILNLAPFHPWIIFLMSREEFIKISRMKLCNDQDVYSLNGVIYTR